VTNTLLFFSSSRRSNPCDELLHLFSALVVDSIRVTIYSAISALYVEIILVMNYSVEVACLMNYSTYFQL
jgi:hypothetical protein